MDAFSASEARQQHLVGLKEDFEIFRPFSCFQLLCGRKHVEEAAKEKAVASGAVAGARRMAP